jgi:nitrate/nitrite-specific signal transduction histidine kinase
MVVLALTNRIESSEILQRSVALATLMVALLFLTHSLRTENALEEACFTRLEQYRLT